MKDELVSFETAKLAKEKGFRKIGGWMGFVDKFYHPRTGTLLSMGRTGKTDFKSLYHAPTQAYLQRWLREVHNMWIEITIWDGCIIVYVKTKKDGELYNDWASKKNHKTYESALEEGLQEALKMI